MVFDILMFLSQLARKEDSLENLRMQFDGFQEELQSTKEELNGKNESILKLNTELTTLRNYIPNLTANNERLEVKVG